MNPSALFSLLLSSLVGILSVGCCAPAPHRPASPELRAQWSGPHSPVEKLTTVVVRTPDEWTALWQRIGAEPPRAIDASSEIAVAVFIGERRTGGYGVEFARVRASQDSVSVEYRERTPPPDSMVPQVITSPWIVGILDATDAPIEFVALPLQSHAKP
jgi:hypothetical protein